MHHHIPAVTPRLEPEEDRWIDGFLSAASAVAGEYSSIDEAIAEIAEQAGTLFVQSFPNFFGWVGELTFPRDVTEMIRAEMRARLTDSVRASDHAILVVHSPDPTVITGPL